MNVLHKTSRALLVSVAAAALLLPPLVYAFKYDNPLDPNYYVERMKEIKGVEDGKITRSDFMKHHKEVWGNMWGHRGDMLVSEHRNPLSPHYGSENISELDKNNDGWITDEEYMKFHEKHWEEWKQKGIVSPGDFIDKNNPLLPSFKR